MKSHIQNSDFKIENDNSKIQRNSAVELLKIIAMFLIVISHVAQTLGSPHPELSYPAECFFDSMHTARDFQHFLILVFRYFGAFGNNLFFICSAWFLCGSRKNRTQRIFQILADVWLLSVLSLSVAFAAGLKVPLKEIVKLLFPTSFCLNWYTTCYICFLFVLPLLNIIIENLSRTNLLKVATVFLVVYCGFNSISARFFYYNDLMFFITVYFFVSYCKKYLYELTENVKLNMALFVISIVLLSVLIFVNNLLGFKIGFFEHNALHWARNNNPLLILAAFSLFNLFRSRVFYSRLINYVSSLTLFIYLIHEGYLLRTYFRPWVWFRLHERFGYSDMAALALVFALTLFIAATFAAAFYKETFARFTKKIGKTVYLLIRRIFYRFARTAEKSLP